MEIKPRKLSDRGGIITMPLKANVPDPKMQKGILRGSLQKRWDGHRRIFLRD